MATKHLVEIPAGTKPKPCRGCDERLWWVKSKLDKWQPITVDEGDPEQYAPTSRESGQGVSHFGNCPNADDFRRER